MEDFKLKKEAAEKAYQDAVTAINNSEETLAALEEEYNKGVYGFFEELGYQNCIDILNNAKYAASTNVNTTGDATQLDQMKQIVAMMKRCNEIRESVGLDPYQVSLELIAIAMSNTNWSSSNIAHSQQFNVGENLSWGWTDPFEGWYFEEKAVYDRIKAELGYSGDNTKDSSALQNQIRAIATQNGEQVGHYLAVISQTYKYFGMAVNSERGQNMYGTTWGMTLSQGGQYTLHAMTVDSFEKLLKDYLDSVDPDLYLSKLEGDLSKAETAKNDTTAEFNKADSALTTATNALGVAKEHKEKLYEATQDDILKVATALEDYNKAKDIVDQKLKEKDSFEDELEKKNSALEVAKENYESKEFEITVYKQRSDLKKQRLQAKKRSTKQRAVRWMN